MNAFELISRTKSFSLENLFEKQTVRIIIFMMILFYFWVMIIGEKKLSSITYLETNVKTWKIIKYK